MLNLNIASELCEKEIKALGIKKYAFSVSSGEKREFNVDGGEFSLMRTLFDTAASVTVYEDGKKGSAATNRLDEEAIRQVVADAHAAAEAALPDEAWDIAPKVEIEPVKSGAVVGDCDKLFDRTKELLSDIKKDFPKIIVEQMIVSYDRDEKIYVNSNGTRFECEEGEYSFDVMFSAHDGEEATSFFSTGAVCDSLDTPFIEMASARKDLADVEAQLNPMSFEGKEVGVILLTPSSLGTFMDYIIENFASDSVILQGTSIWKDKLGEKVADERITVSANPFDPCVINGERLTAEGFIAEGYDFLKNGVLENFNISLYVANKTGKKRAPCSSFPMIIANGDKSVNEIISGIESGIIVGRFSGGEPGTSGDFSGVAKNSFRIENGKITNPLTEVMISGNLADLLNNLIDISSETVCDGASRLPYMAFGGVTISGK